MGTGSPLSNARKLGNFYAYFKKHHYLVEVSLLMGTKAFLGLPLPPNHSTGYVASNVKLN